MPGWNIGQFKCVLTVLLKQQYQEAPSGTGSITLMGVLCFHLICSKFGDTVNPCMVGGRESYLLCNPNPCTGWQDVLPSEGRKTLGSNWRRWKQDPIARMTCLRLQECFSVWHMHSAMQLPNPGDQPGWHNHGKWPGCVQTHVPGLECHCFPMGSRRDKSYCSDGPLWGLF
jgi:hypothetical protein